MRENLNPFIKFCATRTVPSTGTKSIGLRADAHGVMVFASPSRLFHRAPGLTILTKTWYRLDSFIVTRDFSTIYRDLQKPRHRDPSLRSGQATPTHQTAGPLAARQITAASFYQDFRRTRKSFAAHPCNRPFAAKHMLFGLPGLSRLDKFSYIRKSSSFIGTLQSRQIKS